MSHLLIIRSCLISQYSFLFSVKATAENVFGRDWWECGGFLVLESRLLQPPTTSWLGCSIQGEFMQMLPGQCLPPRPGPTWSSLPDMPGACAGPARAALLSLESFGSINEQLCANSSRQQLCFHVAHDRFLLCPSQRVPHNSRALLKTGCHLSHCT